MDGFSLCSVVQAQQYQLRPLSSHGGRLCHQLCQLYRQLAGANCVDSWLVSETPPPSAV